MNLLVEKNIIKAKIRHIEITKSIINSNNLIDDIVTVNALNRLLDIFYKQKEILDKKLSG